MMYRIFPYIIKHHGSIKYLKHVISGARYKSFKPKKLAGKKMFAASSTVPAASVTKNLEHNDELKRKTISKAENLSTKESSLYIKSQQKENHIDQNNQIVNSNLSNVKESCKLQNEFLKPALEPDVTLASCDFPKNEEEKEANAKVVKLLNTVKPSDLDWQKQMLNISQLPKYYKSLSKFRLTGLVVITTVAGYGMAPGPLEPVTLLCMIAGTAFTSAAANAINQILEVPYDSQMARTKNRVLTRGFLSPFHAFIFASSSAVIGLSTLYFGTNSLTALLGATNLILYTSVYTPLKRCSILNTWLGSVVGAIPPLMGWAASTGTLNSGAFLMGAILYAWQFPHFNALSWNLRADYSKAGYRMTSVVDPNLCRKTALRHSIFMLLLCSAAPLVDLTTWTFAVDSFPLNCYLIYCAWQFYKKADSQSSRKLFRLSLIHLPTLMFLMFIGKKYTKDSEKSDKNEL